MKRRVLVAFLACAGLLGQPGVLCAQVDLRLEMAKSSFLQYSPVPFSIRLKNVGPQEIRWSEGSGNPPWLEMMVQSTDGMMIRAEKPLEVAAPVLPPGGVARLELDLAPYFLVRDPGGYRVRGCVRLPSGEPIWTEPLTFLVGRGEVLWSVPRGDNRERRIFSLLKFFEDPNVGLYLRVEVPEQNLVYPSLRLGPYLPLGKPQTEFDSKNHLHVLYAVGAGTQRLTVVNQDGRVLREETRQSGVSQPTLRRDPDGQISVAGGTLILPTNLREKLSNLQGKAAGPARQN